MTYSPATIEQKWQEKWAAAKVYRTVEEPNKKKYYVLDMFPYPSGVGLHMGHALYTATDIVSRFKRMRGFAVLHPMGWDAFGLPAEQNAIATGEPPAKITNRCIVNFKRQLNLLGMDYDWDREISTCDPSYYKWTQWIFRLLFEKGLAYQAEIQVNWCPVLKTVLANDEVVDGKSERGGHPVYRVPMRQWMLKITAYAERLLNDLDKLDWPDATKEIQRHWIGRSTGAKIRFTVKEFQGETIEVFTTRPDTLFGSTYMVLAPEHPLVSKITTAAHRSTVESFRAEIATKSDMDRTELNKEKKGVFTGAFAIHPFTQEAIPIWIADYVLLSYGTGAIMAVPAHDERDHEFAVKHKIKIIEVIKPADPQYDVQKKAHTGDGILVNSDFLNGLDVENAKKRMIERVGEKHCGEATINYRLRDWIFSRQRYWGEPIPFFKDSEGNVLRAFRDDELPLTLPEVESYEPTGDGQSPLAGIKNWVQRIENGKTVFLETHTMPGAAGSSWYFLRYCDPHNMNAPFDIERARYWMPVDLYVGGQEHAVGHLLYSRFWTKVLFDSGLSPVDEPFQKLIHQGVLYRFGARMSKSKGNGVNPDDLISQYGADTLRVYLMFMGPLTQTKEWDDSNVGGIYRFLSRIYRLMLSETGENLTDDKTPHAADLKVLHKTIKKVTDDIEALAFNTAIAQMMICINSFYETECRNREVLGAFLKLVSPFAPHLAEELWSKAIQTSKQNPSYLVNESWPDFDPLLVVDNEITMGVQVNGKHRGEITLAKDSSQQVAVAAAQSQGTIKAALEGKEIKKIIYVPNRILNFVI